MKKKGSLSNSILHVKLMKGGDAYISRCQLLTNITVHVKVFHGDRKSHEIKVSVLDRIMKVFDYLYQVD